MQSTSLLKAALGAASWTLAGHGSSQVLRLLGNLLLTRLLMPESFGVMAVATVISVGVVMFSDLGLRQVLVRSDRTSDPLFVNTVWTLQVAQGLLTAAMMLLAAAGFAYARDRGWVDPTSAYGHPDLPLLVAGLSMCLILAGLESTRLATAEKDMNLRPVVMIEFVSQASALAAMATAALIHPSIFVLLLGALVSGVVKTGASHLMAGGMANRIHWSAPIAAQVFRMSSWIVVSSALTFLSANLDKLLLAALLSSRDMGQFAIAALLVGAISEIVARLSSRVAFPAITAAFHRSRDSLASSYQRVRIPTDAVCVILAAFLFWFGGDVVRLLYDDRYALAGDFLRILAISLIGGRYSVVPYMYLLLGRPGLMAAEQAFRLIGLVVGISAGYATFGVIGAVWGAALGQLGGSSAGLVLFQRGLGLLSVRRELLSLAACAGAFGLFGLASR